MDKDHFAILSAFAQSLSSDSGKQSPHEAALIRGWVDEAGSPTALGVEVVRALGDQEATRSVFRGV